MKKLRLVVSLTALFSPLAMKAQSPTVWVTSSLQRVGPSDAAGSGISIDLSAARDEYESFQVVVRAPITGLTHVDITVTDLQGPNGQTISKSAFTLYREQYV